MPRFVAWWWSRRGQPRHLISALKDGAAQVRFAAARRLAERGDRRAESALREALSQVAGMASLPSACCASWACKSGRARWRERRRSRLLSRVATISMGACRRSSRLGSCPGEVALPLLRRGLARSGRRAAAGRDRFPGRALPPRA